jgi:hypothetical protein
MNARRIMTSRFRRVFLLAVSMLAAATPLPGRAFTAPPPAPPCVPAQAGVTPAALGAVIAGDTAPHIQRCAVKGLATRGAMQAVLAAIDQAKATRDGRRGAAAAATLAAIGAPGDSVPP